MPEHHEEVCVKANISRRAFIQSAGALTLLGAVGGTARAKANRSAAPVRREPHDGHQDDGPMPNTVGEVNHEANGFNPSDTVADFDYGTVSTLSDGRTLREYQIVSADKMLEVLPGIDFPAWTFNGRIPGPTIRATEGDRIRINFINGSPHPHSMHFHGMHPAEMDGVPPGAGEGDHVHPGVAGENFPHLLPAAVEKLAHRR